MAKIKSEHKKSKDKPTYYAKLQAAKLARLAHCMDNYLREENDYMVALVFKERQEHREKLEEITQRQQEEHEERIQEIETDHTAHINHAIELVRRRDERIRQLEAQWEDMANTLHDAIEENFKLIKRIENIEAQLLDCTCNEESV